MPGADLSFAVLTNADLTGAELANSGMRFAVGLSALHWGAVAPNGLYGIREGLRAVGERKAQRELTFSIMRNHRKNAGGLEGAFNYILFEITTDYGLSPGRPLYIACGLILIFTIV